MSKSLNNFFTVRDVGSQMDLEIVRFFMLNAHYRGPVNYSKDLLEQAKSGMERLYNSRDMLEFLLNNADGELSEEEKSEYAKIGNYKEKFILAMDDDLNTADAVSVIFELVSHINTTANEKSSKEYLKALHDLFMELTKVLNIIQKRQQIDTQKIDTLIEKRNIAKKDKNFKEADKIRDELRVMGVELLDTRAGTTYKIIS